MQTRFSSFVLDSDRFLLERAGQKIALRPKVLDLLIVLVENRQRVVPREELVDVLWGGACVGPGSLSGLVNELRRGLRERGNISSSVRTVHARGYQFVAEVTVVRGESSLDHGAVEGNRTLVRAREDWRPAIRPEILKRFTAALQPDFAAGSGLRGFLVEGPARSGKAMLLSELSIYASTLGFEVYRLAHSESDEQNGLDGEVALADRIVDAMVQKSGLEAVARVLPAAGQGLLDRSRRIGRGAAWTDLRASPEAFDPDGEREEAGRAAWLATALQEFSKEAPLLITLPELDRATPGLLAFLGSLVSRLGAAAIVFVATVCVSGKGMSAGARQELDRIAGYEHVECVQIQPLDTSGLRRLLSVRGVDPLPDELLSRLEQHCTRAPGTAEVVASWMAQVGAPELPGEPARRMRVVSASTPSAKISRQA